MLATWPLCLQVASTPSLLSCEDLSLEWGSDLNLDIWLELSSRSTGFRTPPSCHCVDAGAGTKEGPGPLSVAVVQVASLFCASHLYMTLFWSLQFRCTLNYA